MYNTQQNNFNSRFKTRREINKNLRFEPSLSDIPIGTPMENRVYPPWVPNELKSQGAIKKIPKIDYSRILTDEQLACNNIEPITPWYDNDLSENKDTAPQVAKDSIAIISDTLVNALGTISGFGGSEDHFKTILASSMASSLLSLISDTFTLTRNNLDMTTKVTIGLGVTANITNLANTIWFCSAYWKQQPEINKVLNVVPNLVTDFISDSANLSSIYNYKVHEVQSNTNWMDYISPGIKCVTMLGLMIGTGMDKDKMDYAIKLGSMSDLVNKADKNATGIIDFVLTKLCGVDITGDNEKYENILKMSKRTEELAVLPPYKFLQDPKLCSEIEQVYKKSIELKKPTSKETSHSLQIALNGLSSNLNAIREKVGVIKDIMDVKRRQECLGVLLGGEHNVGKSTFAIHIMRKVADTLKYNPDVYNIDKEGGFYTPYNGAAFGILNEFCAKRSDDPTLNSYNKIVSGDGYNMEGAGLEIKTQPCQIKLNIATANTPCPELHQTLTVPAIRALWSRTIRVRVKDPTIEQMVTNGVVKGRHDSYPHRKSDFSHLRLWYTTDTCEKECNIKWTSISVPALINLIISGVAMRELNFLKQTFLENPALEEGAQKRLDYLDNIVSNRVSANSGDDFFVVRLQGKLGGGKSTLARRIANMLSNVMCKMEIVKIKNFDLHEYDKPYIFIVDDIISKANGYSYDDYIRWINNIPRSSIVLLVQNHVFYRKRFVNNLSFSSIFAPFISAYDARDVSTIAGVARRLGLCGAVYHEDTIYHNDSGQITIDAKGNFQYILNGELVSYDDIANIIFRFYKKFRENTTDIIIMRDDPPYIQQYDIDIKTTTIAQLIDSLSSLTNIMRAMSKVDEHSSIHISSELLCYLNGKTPERDWIVKEPVTNCQQLVDLMQRVYASVAKFAPTVIVRIQITEENIELVAKDRIIYVKALEDDEETTNIEWENGNIKLTDKGTTYFITPKEFATYYTQNEFIGSMEELALHQVRLVRLFYEQQITPNRVAFTNEITEQKVNLSILNSKKFKAWMAYKKHPVLIILGSLLGTAAVITALGFFIRWLVKKNPDDVTSNTFGDEEDLMAMKRHYLQHRKNPKFENAKFFKELQTKGFGDRFDEWHSTLNANSSTLNPKFVVLKENNKWDDKQLVENIVKTNSQRDIKDIMATLPDEFLQICSAKSNMLTLKETIWQPPSRLEQFRDSLSKSYVKVITINGQNYGLGLYDRYILTISHAFSDLNTHCSISSGGVVYEAKCIRIMRSRDLAILEVIDKTFPNLPNITKKFCNYSEIGHDISSFFLRPINGGTIYQLPVEYISKTVDPYTDPKNKNYQFSEQIWLARFICGRDLNEIIKKGDCGFPLIVLHNNDYKIIGIHNAFNNMGTAFFSSVNTQDIELASLQSNTSQLMVDCDFFKKDKMKTPQFYVDVFDVMQSSCYEGISDLKILGYIQPLNVPSRPRSTIKKINIPNARTKCETMPSAITYDSKIMDKKELHVNKFNIIVPVFSQAVKFAKRTPEYGTYDKNIHNHVVQLLKLRVKRDYGTFKMLNTKEVLNGNPDSPLNPFDLTTSGGLYLKAKYNLTDKKRIIDNVGTKEKPFYEFAKNSIANEIESLYRECVDSVKKGVPPLLVARDCPKVELLPIEKVRKGKVRLFNELDLHYNMMLKVYFGDALQKVIEQHVTKPYKIGMNPYIEATIDMMRFNCMDGEILSTDVSALDKTMPKEIIKEFVEVFCDYLEEKQRIALSDSLINTLHVMDGSVYLLSTGNESGSFVTTLLNCFCMEFLLFVYFCEMFKEKFGVLPTLAEIENNIVYGIYGDDQKIRFSKDWIVNVENYCNSTSRYNIKITEAKNPSKLVSFCSRVYIPDETGLWYYPALKKSSIVSSMYHYKELDAQYIAQNLNIVLFEASMHEETFFNDVLHDAMIVASIYKINKNYMDYLSYNMYRQVFRDYVMGEVTKPTFLAVGDHARYNKILLLNNVINSNKANVINKNIKMALSQLNEYLMKMKIVEVPEWEDTSYGMDHIKQWRSTVSLLGCSSSGEGTTKKQSREKAALTLLNLVTSNMVKSEISSETGLDNHEMKDLFILSTLGKQVEIAEKISTAFDKLYLFHPESVYNLKVTNKMVDTIRVDVREVKEKSLYSVLSVGAQKAFSQQLYNEYLSQITKQKFELDEHGTYLQRPSNTSNMDSSQNPVEPANMDQASAAQQISSIPSGTNPQPTMITPAMTSTGEDIMGAVQNTQPEILQPVGAPPMLGVGAIDFDLKALVYQQYIDSDIEFTVSDDQPSGTILLQIPYDPLGTYVNKYIKQWVSIHERYTGAMMFRITTIGNPMFSGAIGICWVPKKQAGSTINISDTMVYSYQVEGVTLPWNRIHILHDARREFFYRTTNDTDIDNRPHLVIYLNMSIQNPLKPDAITRLRIASKLSNMADVNPFRVANPVLPTTPSLMALSPYQGDFFNMFKQCFYKKMFVYTDGNLVNQQLSNTNYTYYQMDLNYPNQVAQQTNLTGDQRLNTQAAVFEINAQNSMPYTWTSFESDKDVCVRFSIYGASQYFVVYNTIINDILQAVYTGGETTLKLQMETYIPTGRIVFDDPNNPLQAMWAYRAPENDPPNDIKNFGGYKMVFAQGIIIVDVFKSSNDNGSVPTGEAKNPTINYGYIDNPRLFIDPTVEPISSNCSVLRITTQQPSSVPASVQGPTARDDEAMLRYFAGVAKTVDPSQVIQMQLVDAITLRNVMTLRYNPLINGFYVYGDNGSYKVLPRDLKDINVGKIEIVPLANPMPVTDTITWSSRIISATSMRKTPVSDELYTPRITGNEVHSNFLPILSSILGGNKTPLNELFSFGQNIYSTERGIQAQKEMQGSYHEWKGDQNQLERDFINNLTQGRFGHEIQLQGNEMENQRQIAQQKVRNQAYLSGTTTGLRNLPGSIFS